ncbi:MULTISPECIES: EFR1 family ferrodoxin [unclassified Fusibacter]|uniref:EFR1 family ferrodoxin n=1 Tax=unclassified Fusibacter TaxID=2624464 RepID=UPI0013E98AFC|nr:MULTISPECIES: EFR1 family ferrodoxin [unclassified Fusibacter]MCK8058928.1 EFR1 family ferrodoxin [Fusibacter sp. A2]NPE22003.1 hypothetical protein [Fusibacter sp. A1]
MIQVLYFSGTGNTEYVSKIIERNLQSADLLVKRNSIESFTNDMSIGDILVFGFPIYACDIPKFIKKFIIEMEPVNKLPVYLFATKAFLSGNALRVAEKLFKKKGYEVKGVVEVFMPGSDALAFKDRDSSMVKSISMMNFDEIEVVSDFTKAIISGDGNNYSHKPKIGDYLLGDLIKGVYPLLENMLQKKFKTDERCILCGRCQRICPSANIVVDHKVTFNNRCYLCMRCIHNCPAEAIQIGKSTIDKFRWHGPKGDFSPENMD